MKNQIMLFFLFLLSVFCCSKTDNGTLPVIDVLGPTSGSIENLSDIAENIQFISLETTPESLIGNINGIAVKHDGSIFVGYSLKKVGCFNSEGRYLYTLDKEGRGPGEYIGFLDFDVSEDGDYITVIGEKIDVYDINGGMFNHVRTIQFNNPEKPFSIELTSKDNKMILPYYSSHGTEPYKCLILSFEGDTLGFRQNFYKYEKPPNFSYTYFEENIIYQLGDNVYLFNDLSDTIFEITDKNEFSPHMILNRGEKSLKVQDRENLTENIDVFEFVDQFLRFRRLFESERYVYGLYRFENQKYAFIFDKEDQQKYRVDGMKFFTDDLSGGINFEPKYYNNGFVYSWVDAITLKNHVASDEFKNSVPKIPEKRQQLVELTDNLEETDNPVLVVVKLKK